jgi:hypothetical protein
MTKELPRGGGARQSSSVNGSENFCCLLHISNRKLVLHKSGVVPIARGFETLSCWAPLHHLRCCCCLLPPPLRDGGISPAFSFCCHDRVSRYLGSTEDGLLTTIVACIAALLFKGRVAAKHHVQPLLAVYRLFYLILVQPLRLANNLDAAPEVSCQIRPRKFHLSRDRGALDFGFSPQLLPLESTVWLVGVGCCCTAYALYFQESKNEPMHTIRGMRSSAHNFQL